VGNLELSVANSALNRLGETRPDSFSQSLTEIVVRNRRNLWIPGGIDDIKNGSYPVEVMHYPNNIGLESDISEIEGPVETGTNPNDIYKLALGLENNVLISNNGQQILVIDSHMFALPFLLNLFNSRKLSSGVDMQHIDDHRDLGTCGLNIEDLKNKSGTQVIRTLYEETRPGTWLYNPLIVSGLVDFSKWQWKYLDTTSLAWTTYEMVNKYGKIEKIPFPNSNPTILDVDIDFIRPAEKGSSHILKNRLADVIVAGKNAKYVIIATSPAFINRGRAIEYTKELVTGLLR